MGVYYRAIVFDLLIYRTPNTIKLVKLAAHAQPRNVMFAL